MLDEWRDQYTFSLLQKVFLSLYSDTTASLFGLEIVAERIALGTEVCSCTQWFPMESNVNGSLTGVFLKWIGIVLTCFKMLYYLA